MKVFDHLGIQWAVVFGRQLAASLGRMGCHSHPLDSCFWPLREIYQYGITILKSSGFCHQTTNSFTNRAVTEAPLRCHSVTLIVMDGESN